MLVMKVHVILKPSLPFSLMCMQVGYRQRIFKYNYVVLRIAWTTKSFPFAGGWGQGNSVPKHIWDEWAADEPDDARRTTS